MRKALNYIKKYQGLHKKELREAKNRDNDR